MCKIKRFIDCYVPVTTCTLRCHYCYITHQRLFSNKLPKFKYEADVLKRALTQERLGGTCMFNFCGGGETLLPPEMPSFIKAVLGNGHYVMVVTNATVSKRFDEIIGMLSAEECSRLFFKFSFHYLELKKRKLLDKFFANINKVREAGCSFTLEITPSDELIPYIEEVKRISLEKVGAICHCTVARDEQDPNKMPLLTKMSKEDYIKTWSQFDSDLFKYKISVFGEKRNEFCYAGDWSCYLNIGTGQMSQCYVSLYKQNIFDDVTKPINFLPIGCNCQEFHCFNAHAFLTFGDIPELESPTYDSLRNRTCLDGSEWLTPNMKEFMSHKLVESNMEYTEEHKVEVDIKLKKFKIRRKIQVSKEFLKFKIKEIIGKK